MVILRQQIMPWVYFLAALNWVDAALTIFILQYAGGIELNPLINLLIGQLGLWSLLIAKAVTTGLLFGVVLVVKPCRTLSWMVKGLVIVYSLITVWNVLQVW